MTAPQFGADLLSFWHKLEELSVLQCPGCRGKLEVTDKQFNCLACSSVYPVESGVPLLLKPDEVVSSLDEVMKVFNIPPALKDHMEAALTPLIKYRTFSHPEFANFFARFDARAVPAQPVPLTTREVSDAVAKVECLTHAFPYKMSPDVPEFRSIRLWNRSDRVLFTDERSPLYIGYRIFTTSGHLVPCKSERSPIPVPLRPGSELTVPVLVRLPPGAAGPLVVRFHFMLVEQASLSDEVVPPEEAAASHVGWMSFWREKLWSRPRSVVEGPRPTEEGRWFDASSLADMAVTATAEADEFPALHLDGLKDFDVHEDVARADRFVANVVAELKAAGISSPRILEVGSGVYPIALRTCGLDSTVVVSDISLVMQTLASVMHRGDLAVREGRAAFASLDMMHPPFGEGTFDIVCICAAFHHIPYPGEFLKRLAPILSPQGRFVAVREPCVVNPYEPTYISELTNGFNEQMFELSEWKAILSQGGFALDKAVIDFDCSLKFSARVSSPAIEA